jgi:acyl-coenzyme A thioesterase PaaI-like protein
MDSAPAIQMLEQGIAFVARSGLKVESLERGRVVCRMPFKGNENHIGTMYAGALYTLAELPGGALFLSSFDTSRYFPIVKESTLRFTAPATSDVTIDIRLDDTRIAEIQGEADSNGKCEFVLEGELKDASGKVVAISRSLYQLRSNARKPTA